MEHQAELVGTLQLQGAGCAALGSPFYEALCEQMVLDVAADGPATRLLAPFADAPFEAAYVLRFLAGVHRMVLSGAAPALAGHFPSTGGDGDPAAAMARMAELLIEPPEEVLDALTRPPQTNEVGRSIALASGLLVIADQLSMPLRLREIGASAGLNLRLDSYWYEQDGHGWGDPASPVRFIDLWDGSAPPFVAGSTIVDRRGCDRHPIDVTTEDGALTLMSYVWPEPGERFERARAAISMAQANPVTIDSADVEDWLPQQLEDRPTGTALVVVHSVVWQYLHAATRASIATRLQEAGNAVRAATPLAWLRLEPHPETYAPAELRLTLWDGHRDEPEERLLATTSFHGGPINWIGGDRR
jgi:hypothetical protein